MAQHPADPGSATADQNQHKDQAEPQYETITPTQHVGRTLEAEGIFTDVLGTALPVGESSPDRVRPDQVGVDEVDVRTAGEDIAYSQSTAAEDAQREQGAADAESSIDPATPLDDTLEEAGFPLAANLGEAPEALKTRLPGDTSSDPHTDLGPDNATTAHATVAE